MRAPLFGLVLGGLLAMGGPGPAVAQDGGGDRPAADLGAHYLATSEAKLAEGRALIAAGKTEEGLAVLREIPALLAKHEALWRARVPAAPVTEVPAVPGPLAPASSRTAVEGALRWLVQHQDPDGAWSCDGFWKHCKTNACKGTGSAEYTVGTTALAALALLGAGATPGKDANGTALGRAIERLCAWQGTDGCIRNGASETHFVYGHALGTMALAEAYGMSGAASLRPAAERAVRWLEQARNPYLGWRYGVKPGDNDTSVTTIAVLALKSASLAGITVDPAAFEGAKAWYDKVTDPSFFKTGYTQRGDNGARMPDAQQFQPGEAMTAAAVAGRFFIGTKRDDPVIKGGVTLITNMLPRWDPEKGNDFYGWWFGTLATFQYGGEAWKKWDAALKTAVLDTQRRGGDESGSWDPSDAWGTAGGRVYATAVNCLTAEISFRYSNSRAQGK